MDNRVGLNLLYAQVRDPTRLEYLRNLPVCAGASVEMNVCSLPHQTVSDIERGWILVNKDQHRQLKSLQEKGSKKEVSRRLGYFCLCRTEAEKTKTEKIKEAWRQLVLVVLQDVPFHLHLLLRRSQRNLVILSPQFIHLGQTLKYYGYVKFDPCVTDFPEKGCQVIVSAGNNELNFHVKLPNEQMKEGSFKVTRMRCWRVTSSVSVCVCERERVHLQADHSTLSELQQLEPRGRSKAAPRWRVPLLAPANICRAAFC